MNEVIEQSNAFGGMNRTAENAIATSDEARAIQQVQAAMVIAKRFPRDQIRAIDRIRNACTRPKLAEKALYYYKRGGSAVTGPSIRLAEVLAQEWGNLQSGVRELSQSNGVSTVEAFAWDLETNFYETKVFQVPHVRYSKEGGMVKLVDPRDIYEHIANQGSRRKRACILAVIPGDVVEEAVDQCGVTQSANVDMSPDKIKAMLGYFEGHGVTQELVEKRLGKRVDAMVPAQMLMLRNVAESMKDGMSKASDWFDIDEGAERVGPKVSSLSADMQQKPAASTNAAGTLNALDAATSTVKPEPEKKAARTRKPKAEADIVDPPTDEQEASIAVDTAQPATMSAEDQAAVDDFLGAGEPTVTYASIADSINKAVAVSELDALMPVIIKYLASNPVDRAALSSEYSAKKKALFAATQAV